MQTKIYDAAIGMFEEFGYESVKVTNICVQANVSLGTFYRYFASKERLLERYSSAANAHLDAIVDHIISTSPTERCRQLMLTRISFSTKWGEIADNAHIQIRNVSSADAFSPDRGFYKILAETLRKGIEDGEFKPGLSVEVTVNTVNYIITGFDTHWALANREFDINEAA